MFVALWDGTRRRNEELKSRVAFSAVHDPKMVAESAQHCHSCTCLLLLTTWFTNILSCNAAVAIADQRTELGSWELLIKSSGVVAMHMALTHRNTVIMFDQTSAGPSGYRMQSHGNCSGEGDQGDPSCWAHSVEYDISTNAIRPLVLKTDTWCSSGAFLSDGVLSQTGGYGNGTRKVRYFAPCSTCQCDWWESGDLLTDDRWYATNQVLPEKDRVIVVGGRNAYTYEFVPKFFPGEGAFELPFLRQTCNKREAGDNLYPFVHLSPDGHLFIFANRDSILLDYRSNKVVKQFPTMPGGMARNYPSTGSSVLLPLEHDDGFQKAEVMVCGGAAAGAYRSSGRGEFYESLSSCGRLVITSDNSSWVMEDMPGPRLMNDILILPNGDILIINGATHGTAGWQRADGPSYSPYLYEPKRSVGERFTVLAPSSIARMYHSSAIVLPDGRVLVAGSNPYKVYTFNVQYPTELRVEAFSPHYLDQSYDDKRPSNLWIRYGHREYGIRYGRTFVVWFQLWQLQTPTDVEFFAYAPPFATHSFSMNQRMLKLQCSSLVREKRRGGVHAVLVAPPSAAVAPAGFYLLTVVNAGIPSKSEWVRFTYE